MARVIWSRRALRDLKLLGEYIAAVSPQSRERLLTGIVEATERIALFPRIGRTVREFQQDDIREVLHDSYRIVYLVEGQNVVIVTIVHAAMDVAARLRDPGE